MEVNTEKLPNASRVFVSGRLDSLSSPVLESHVIELIELADTETKIVLDLEAVEYVSSAGLRVFLMIAKTSNRKQREFVICNVKQDIADIIEMSGFSVILNIKPTLQDALA